MKKINTSRFKKTLSKFSTGVTVVAINHRNKLIGKTINSFAAFSLNPPIVLFSLDKKSSSLELYKKTKYISINILSNKQVEISKHFARNHPDWGKVPFKLSLLKIPNINKCIGNLECKKIKFYSYGDHILFLCEVLNSNYNDNLKPLLYFNSKYL